MQLNTIQYFITDISTGTNPITLLLHCNYLCSVHGVFAEDLECVEFHMASLLFAGKTNEFILFAKAAIVHPQVGRLPV